jgi:TolB-like protein
LNSFDVVPSTSARQYDDRRPSVREIAAALKADILLEARTSTEAGKIKVEVRLSAAAADRKFWVGDEFIGENLDELAGQIVHASHRAIADRR